MKFELKKCPLVDEILAPPLIEERAAVDGTKKFDDSFWLQLQKARRNRAPGVRHLTWEQYKAEAADRARWNEKLPKPLNPLERVIVPREKNGNFKTTDGAAYARDAHGVIRRKKNDG